MLEPPSYWFKYLSPNNKNKLPQLLKHEWSFEQVPEIPQGPPHRLPAGLAQTGQHPQTSLTYSPLSQHVGTWVKKKARMSK